MSTVASLRKQLADTQAKLDQETQKLQAERAKLVSRLAEIDSELAGEPKTVKPRTKGIGQQIVAYVAQHPGSTIRDVQAGLPDLPASSVETNLRSLAGKGTLAKDDSTPRKFSVPAPVAPEKPVAPAPEKPASKSNGHARAH